jgi:hypothetical protein
MQNDSLNWRGPFYFATLDFSMVPSRSGVYAFTEYPTSITPNPPLPPEGAAGYEEAIERFRAMPCLLYVGKATTLSSRVRGYRFRPYLEIRRRPKGTPPRHEADEHKGRAMLHAQQFFAEWPLYFWWSETSTVQAAEFLEGRLIRELRPALNTAGVVDG